ncbi:Myotubularin-related protein 14, partial [Stegodyphus mimosarum]
MAIQWIERGKEKKCFQQENFEYEMNIDTAVFILLNLKYLEELKDDGALLQYLGVRYIYDLRVKSMKDKYTAIVNSSAEASTQLYKNFNTAFVPYPGIEYFIAYHYNPNPE